MIVTRLALLLSFSTALTAADLATIINSGSTNMAGFRIVVERSGKAAYTSAAGKTQNRRVAKSLAARFYKDLDAAKPLSGLPSHGCMKSASFGSTLKVEMGSDESPDLSCGDGGNAAMAALIQDANEIVKSFPPQPVGREVR